MATGALGTGINIEGIIYVIHVDRPYGLTSFLQQSGRGGRNGEISDSIIIVQVQNSYDWRGRNRMEVSSAYSVEEADEEAMTAFILAPTCRRKVLNRYMDPESDKVDCISTDSVFCDWCKVSNGPRLHIGQVMQVGPEARPQAGLEVGLEAELQAERKLGRNARQNAKQRAKQQAEQLVGQPVGQLAGQPVGELAGQPVGQLAGQLVGQPAKLQEPTRRYFIHQQLRATQESCEDIVKVMDWLLGQCLYCTLIYKG